jgi:hypothetical protein
VNFQDLLSNNLCGIVREAAGMAVNTVRPANQTLPIGDSGDEFATVFIYAQGNKATPEKVGDVSGAAVDAVEMDYYLDTYQEFTASVQFYRARRAPTSADEGAFVDSVGIMEQSQWGFNQANRLPSRFWLPSVRMLLQQNGIAFLGQKSAARDLTALNDSLFESRGQVDLDFGIVARETTKVQFLAALQAQLIVAEPGGDVHQTAIEVPIP